MTFLSGPEGEQGGLGPEDGSLRGIAWVGGRPTVEWDAPVGSPDQGDWSSGGSSVPIGEEPDAPLDLDESGLVPWRADETLRRDPGWHGSGRGWSADFERPFRRRRSRGVRVIGAVAAVALLITSVGAGVGIVVEDGEAPSFSVAVHSVAPAGATLTSGGHASGTEQVTFVVDNQGQSSAAPQCTVEVLDKGVAVGVTSVTGQPELRGGRRAPLAAAVPISRPAFAGRPGDARVICY